MGFGDKALSDAKGGSKIGGPFKKAALSSIEQALKQKKFLFGQAKPVQKELFGQTLEALRTGGVGAQIPIIQRTVESQKQALSGSLKDLEGGLAGSNLAGTPFGQRILAQTAMQGRQEISNVPTAFAQQFISGAPGLTQGATGQGINLLGQASQTGAGIYGQQLQGKQAKGQSKAQGAGAGFGALAACDANLKRCIQRVGTSPRGFGIFEFEYIAQPGVRMRGPVAQDAQRIDKHSVVRGIDGLLYVNTNRVDVPIDTV